MQGLSPQVQKVDILDSALESFLSAKLRLIICRL